MKPQTAAALKGMVQSLALNAGRKLLCEIAEEIGGPVLFLKAAWADPVLYGGQGERSGSDIDILVRGEHFDSFVAALEKRGFSRWEGLEGNRGRYFDAKEITFSPPPGSLFLTVDLHRELTDPCWFHCPVPELFERAVSYATPEGPILSLAPEDQVTYACLHYANHVFDLDERHLNDVKRLIDAFPIDWKVVEERATRMALRVALHLLRDGLLRSGGPDVPFRSGPGIRFRAFLVRRLIGRKGAIERGRRRGRLLDYLLVRPLLSDDWFAAPKFAWNFGAPWLGERLRGWPGKRSRATGSL